MTNILTHQNPEANKNNIVIIDGDKKPTLTEEASALLDTSRMRKICMFKKGKGASTNLQIYKSKEDEVIIISNFEDKDELGRRIVFTFYGKNGESATGVANTLQTYSDLAGKHLSESDYNSIIKCLDSNSTLKIVAIATSIVAFLASILLVLSKCNK